MTQHRFTIAGNSRADLLAAFHELFGEDGETTANSAVKAEKASRSRKGAAAPDPAPIPATAAQPDPFAAAPAAAGPTQAAAAADPFAAAPQPPGDDPFAAPATAPTTAAAPLTNPAVEKLIERLELKVSEPTVGPNRMRDYLAKLLGLAPSVTLAEMYSKLRGGSFTQDVIDKLLDQTGGR